MDILLFGITKDIAGSSKLVVPQTAQVTNVAELKTWLGGQFPAIQKLTSLAVAVDNEYAEDDVLIGEHSEIALIPPVSGG